MGTAREVSFPFEGGSAAGHFVPAAGDGAAPAVLVIHEWWGINDDIRAICGRFADAGLSALAVDLYGGRSTADASEAMQWVNELKTGDAMKVVAGALAWVRAQPGVSPKVGITGFCLGGAMSIAAACTVPGLAAAVPFYGTPRDEFIDFSGPRPPILGHYGRKDPIVSVDRVEAIAAKASAAGCRFDVQLYDAGHAFMRSADPSAYHAESAALAWERTIDFLRAELR